MDGIRPQRLLLENGHAGSGSGDMGELVPELLADNGATTSAAEQHTLADDSDEVSPQDTAIQQATALILPSIILEHDIMLAVLQSM